MVRKRIDIFQTKRRFLNTFKRRGLIFCNSLRIAMGCPKTSMDSESPRSKALVHVSGTTARFRSKFGAGQFLPSHPNMVRPMMNRVSCICAVADMIKGFIPACSASQPFRSSYGPTTHDVLLSYSTPDFSSGNVRIFRSIAQISRLSTPNWPSVSRGLSKIILYCLRARDKYECSEIRCCEPPGDMCRRWQAEIARMALKMCELD